MEKTWKREYVRRKHEKEYRYVCRKCGREGMLGENIKTFERGYVRRKHGRECMFWRKHGREGVFGEKHWREGMFGENICIGERVGKEKRRGLMEIT